MRKKELLKLRKLEATDAMMARAKADKIITRKNRWVGTYKSLKYECQMRVQILNGILKAAIFQTLDMKKGEIEPRWEVYCDPVKKQFITYDCKEEKWLTAKVDMLKYAGTGENRWYCYGLPHGTFCNHESRRTICHILGVKEPGIQGILKWQENVRAEKIAEKERKITAPWDRDMELIPGIPSGFGKWAHKEGVREHYIFYKYEKKGPKYGYCTHCEKAVPISKPKYGAEAACQICGTNIVYKSTGRTDLIASKRYKAYLIQPFDGGYCIRMFEVWNRYKAWMHTDFYYSEQRRAMFFENGTAKAYIYENWKQKGMRWVSKETLAINGYNFYGNWKGRVMPLDQETEMLLSRTGLPEMCRSGICFDPEYYAMLLTRQPFIEQVAKAGLTRLTADIVQRKLEVKSKRKTGELNKILGLDKFRIRRLRDKNGGYIFFAWLSEEKKKDTVFSDDMILYFEKNNIRPDDVTFISDRMSPQKICNYIQKQAVICDCKPKETLQTWKDYLDMAKRLKMNVQHELFYKPKNLRKAHDDCVKEGGQEAVQRRIKEINKKFPDIDKICQSIKSKYEFSDEKYSIVVPEKVADIIFEGRTLGHCLDRSDIYFDRIQRRESYIVFLRKTKSIDVPYYTLEIEPDGTARQKRTTGDRQNKDFDDAKHFIKKWQKAIQKNLSVEDRNLADQSAKLRIEEFIKLRKDKAKIWHGALAGQLLVDVLEADLMEVEAENRRWG